MKILIVGAGIAGLSLSHALRLRGIEHTIIEKEHGPTSEGAGIALPFNAVKALEALGLAEQVLNAAYKVEKIKYVKASGELLSQTDLNKSPFESSHFIALRRSELHSVLVESLAQKVHYGCRISAINATPNGNTVSCSQQELSGDYDLVIAADGVNSATRSFVYKHKRLVYEHDIVTWRFIHKIPNHGIQPTYYFGKTDVFMTYPISPDALYCYAHVHRLSKMYQEGDTPKKNLLRLFSHYAEPVPAILQSLKASDIIQGKLKSVVTPNYYANRVAFIGDAANACSPLLQQGAAAAFEDALCLAECLSTYDLDLALTQYKKLRKARVGWTVNYSDSPLRTIHKMEKPLPRYIRNLIIRLIGPLNVYGWKKLAREKRLRYLTPSQIKA